MEDFIANLEIGQRLRRGSFVPPLGSQGVSAPQAAAGAATALPSSSSQPPIHQWLMEVLQPHDPADAGSYASRMAAAGFERAEALRGLGVEALMSKFGVKEGHARLVAAHVRSEGGEGEGVGGGGSAREGFAERRRSRTASQLFMELDTAL